MSKKVCAKTVLNVLFYHTHRRSFDNFEKRYLPNILKPNSYDWVKEQSSHIENNGFDDWLKNTDAPYGVPPEMKSRPTPYLYTIKFRTNIFYT